MKPPFLPPRSIYEQLANMQLQLDELKKQLLPPWNNIGEWNATTNYNEANMFVSYGGGSYVRRAQGDCINLAPDINPTYWQQVAAPGTPGAQGEPGTNGTDGNGIADIYTVSHTTVNNETVTKIGVAYTETTPAGEFEVHAQNGAQGINGVPGFVSGTLTGAATGTANRTFVPTGLKNEDLLALIRTDSFICLIDSNSNPNIAQGEVWKCTNVSAIIGPAPDYIVSQIIVTAQKLYTTVPKQLYQHTITFHGVVTSGSVAMYIINGIMYIISSRNSAYVYPPDFQTGAKIPLNGALAYTGNPERTLPTLYIVWSDTANPTVYYGDGDTSTSIDNVEFTIQDTFSPL